MAKVGEGEGKLSQHLPAPKSRGILRLCHRRNHYRYALAEGVEGCVVGSKGRGVSKTGVIGGGGRLGQGTVCLLGFVFDFLGGG